MFALNLKTTATTSEIYLETDNYRCIRNTYEDYSSSSSSSFRSKTNRFYNSTEEISSEEDESNSTVVLPVSTLPHLSDFIGWSVQGDDEVNDCKKYKIFDTEFDNGRGTTRIYRDLLIFIFGRGKHMSTIEHEMEIGQIFEENIAVKNDGYQINQTYSVNWRNGHSISANVQNNGTKTIIQISAKDINYYPGDYHKEISPGDIRFDRSDSLSGSTLTSLDMEIDESQTQRYKSKLIVGNDKIFDAWFYDAFRTNRNIKDLVNTRIPHYLNQKSFTLTNFILADITNKFEQFAELVRQNY